MQGAQLGIRCVRSPASVDTGPHPGVVVLVRQCLAPTGRAPIVAVSSASINAPTPPTLLMPRSGVGGCGCDGVGRRGLRGAQVTRGRGRPAPRAAQLDQALGSWAS